MTLLGLLKQLIKVPAALKLTGVAVLVALTNIPSAYAGGELPGERTAPDQGVVRHKVSHNTKTYVEFGPKAVYARSRPAGIAYTYGTRRYAGREYLVVPGQWYPPVWEDSCTVKRTCAMPGVAAWPGVRVDLNSDEIELAPVGPRPLPTYCGL